MRVAIDYTPAIAQGAGVGRYARSLVEALLRSGLEPEDRLVLWAARPKRLVARPPESEWVEVRALPLSERWVTIGWQRLRLPLALERLIGPVDVAHATDFVAPPSHAPAIASVHDLSFLIAPQFAHPRLRRYLSGAVPRTLRRVSRVVAISEATARDIERCYGFPRERIAVIPVGVDPMFRPASEAERERVLERLGISTPYLLIVGTVEPRKNHLTLLRAFERLHPRYPDVALVIVGRPGWLSEPIVAAIERAAESLPIRHLRSVTDADLPALYGASLALVYPSWYEGFGLPVVEAMACGAPVVTSRVGALAEVAGDAALLVDPADPDALADAMSALAEDGSLRAELIRRGAARAAQFSWSQAAEAHLRLYREVARAQ